MPLLLRDWLVHTVHSVREVTALLVDQLGAEAPELREIVRLSLRGVPVIFEPCAVFLTGQGSGEPSPLHHSEKIKHDELI
jgi:hypothetical protein